jgi:CRP-like cAMP-binding protein
MRLSKRNSGDLGNVYKDGEYIVRQGEPGNCMYEIQTGKVEVLRHEEGKELLLSVLEKGDFFGEMALFEKSPRSASIRAKGEARVLTIDKRILMRRISQDPTLAFRLLEKMSGRIRELNSKLVQLDYQS